MKKLATEAQQKELSSALKSAIININNGANPDEAIAKEAVDHGFGADFASRMVEAYNTSKTLHHYTHAPAEKKAET